MSAESDYALVSIIIPSTVRSYPIPDSAFQRRVHRALADIAAITGGATTESTGRGAWIASDGRIVVESIVKVWTFTTADKVAALLDLGRAYARDFSQESVLAIVGDQPTFLSA